MIFVTVGHQMPFDRMVRAIDEWAGKNPGVEIFAQIGETDYAPRHMRFVHLLNRAEFDANLRGCHAVVAHAGTGTIIQVLLAGKPLLVYPRLTRLRETRTDHQVGTARRFAEWGHLMAAYSEEELVDLVPKVVDFTPAAAINARASGPLISRIASFVRSGTG